MLKIKRFADSDGHSFFKKKFLGIVIITLSTVFIFDVD